MIDNIGNSMVLPGFCKIDHALWRQQKQCGSALQWCDSLACLKFTVVALNYELFFYLCFFLNETLKIKYVNQNLFNSTQKTINMLTGPIPISLLQLENLYMLRNIKTLLCFFVIEEIICNGQNLILPSYIFCKKRDKFLYKKKPNLESGSTYVL